MIIKRISCYADGCESFEKELEPGTNIFSCKQPEEVFSETLFSLSSLIRTGTNLRTNKDKVLLTVEKFGIPETFPGICDEYLACRAFEIEKADAYPAKINKYLYYSENYSGKEFYRLTNQLGTTKVFRAYIHEYIKNFKPVLLSQDSDVWLVLERDGIFKAKKRCGNSFKEVSLNRERKIVFDFLCFLKLNEFWDGAEELRGISCPCVPVLCKDFPEIADECLTDIMSTQPMQLIFFTKADALIDNVPFTGHN